MTFGEPEDLTRTGDQGFSMRVPFNVRAAEEETGPGTRHELIVRLSGARTQEWGLNSDRARAVLIHAAVGHLLDVVRQRPFEASEEILVDDDYAGPMPEHFDRPIAVKGSSIEMERNGG
jgi:hypothetical protein